MAESPLVAAVIGIAGVGKSFLVKSLSARHPEIAAATGGSLLQRRAASDRDMLRIAPLDIILNNQDIIRDEFLQLVSQSDAAIIIFDGHCVINSGTDLIAVPSKIFKEMGISRIAFVHDDPNAILLRRVSDPTRRRALQTASEINQEQRLALSVCQSVVRELNIPLCQVISGDVDTLERFIFSEA